MSWTFEFADESSKIEELFDIILGFSMTDVVAHEVESITFHLLTEQGQLLGYSETIDTQTLRDWCVPGMTGAERPEVREWRLHQRLECNNASQRIMIFMKIESSQYVQAKAGYFEMHYMDIDNSSPRVKGASFLQVKPFIWSIDINQLYVAATSGNPPSIYDYAISGDGSTAAILSVLQHQLVLDVWDLRSCREPASGLAKGDSNHQKPDSFTPRHGAHLRVQEPLRGKVFVSISWDGTQIAVTDTSDMKSSSLDISNRSNAPILYQYDKDGASAKGLVVSVSGSLYLSDNYRKCKGAYGPSGYGKFHIQTTTNQIPTDEMIVICDGHSVAVYNVFPTWELKATIELDQPQQDHERLVFRSAPQELIRSLCGRYFTWAGHDDDVVSVCDMSTGTVVPCFPKILQETPEQSCRRISTCFSGDGIKLVIARDRTLTLHISVSGEELESFIIPHRDKYVKSIQFVRDDTELLVATASDHRTSSRWEPGYLLNAATLLVLDRVHIPSRYPARVFGKHLVYHHRSTLELIRL
ncbi:hypothetical protein BGZ68_006899 [Mortierella alpina]|nr:hypothetical protein BGZ68_006899 [Mortierella alpina]